MVTPRFLKVRFSPACALAWVLCSAALGGLQCAAAADAAAAPRNDAGYVVSTTQAVDPPGRVGRLSVRIGQVWIYSPEEAEWVSAERNRPISSGDRISTDAAARAEVRIGSTVLRLDSNTELEVQLLDDERLYLRLHRGSCVVRLRDKQVAAQFAMYTPEGQFSTQRVGQYRFDRRADGVDDQSGELASGESASGRTHATALNGQLQYEGNNQALTIRSGQRAEFEVDANDRAQYATGAPERDAFAAWNSARDLGESNALVQERPAALRYVSPEMTGAEDLERYGRWQQDAQYGAMWYPRDVAPGWAPYSDGRWMWRQPWGWTWVDQAPWGFAPFHYGRWVRRHNIWGWAPGTYQARPVYAPGLVGWVGQPPLHQPGIDIGVSIGNGASLGWFPLGPHEVYAPGYGYSPGYGRELNRWPNPPFEHGRDDPRPHDHGGYPPRYSNRDAPNAVTMLPPGRDQVQDQDRRVHTPMRTGDAARDAGNQRRWITPRVQRGEPAVVAPVVRDEPSRGGRHDDAGYGRDNRRDDNRDGARGGDQRGDRSTSRTPDAGAAERRETPAPQLGPRFDPTDRRMAR